MSFAQAIPSIDKYTASSPKQRPHPSPIHQCPLNPPSLPFLPSHVHHDIIPYEEAASLTATLFASARLLFSPCFPFYIPLKSAIYPSTQGSALTGRASSFSPGIEILTFHFANLNSICPLRSAINLCSSLRLRRTTRAAMAR